MFAQSVDTSIVHQVLNDSFATAREISAARAPVAVKVLAYKNGDGRMKPGEIIIGSSLEGVS